MKLRITTDGAVRALHNDELDWAAIGRLNVKRASHVEFCARRQQWIIRTGRPRRWWRQLQHWLLGRPMGEIVFVAYSRTRALAWESRHFGPGGDGWPEHCGVKLNIDAQRLHKQLGVTRVAMATDPSRYALDGILLEADQHGLRLVATDGRRLAIGELSEPTVDWQGRCDPARSYRRVGA